MDWTTILTGGFVAGCVSGAISQIAPWAREAISNNKAAGFSALRLALMLEDYAGKCSSLYSETQTAIGTNGHAGMLHTSLPELPDFPSDIAWLAMGTKLSSKVLNFPVVRSEALAAIGDDWEHNSIGYVDEHADYVSAKAVELGLRAIAIAERLRWERKLGSAWEDPKSNTKVYLAAQWVEVEAQRARFEAQKAEEAMTIFGGIPQ